MGLFSAFNQFIYNGSFGYPITLQWTYSPIYDADGNVISIAKHLSNFQFDALSVLACIVVTLALCLTFKFVCRLIAGLFA